MVTVKVGQVPGTITEVGLNGEHTALDAFKLAGFTAEDVRAKLAGGFDLKINAEPGSLDDELEDGDTATIVKKIKGA